MSRTHDRLPLARRSFFARLGTGAFAFGAAFGAQAGSAQSVSRAPFAPPRHDLDDWMELAAAKHRLFLDTTTFSGVASAIAYASNFLAASSSAYGLADADAAILIGVRAGSVSFAYNDAMWAKYGGVFSDLSGVTDPNTKQAPTVNVLQSGAYSAFPNRGITLETLLKRGARLSVCQLATRAVAGAVARKTAGSADDIYKELALNLVPSAHLVPAGIVALSRAQERGFTFGYVA